MLRCLSFTIDCFKCWDELSSHIWWQIFKILMSLQVFWYSRLEMSFSLHKPLIIHVTERDNRIAGLVCSFYHAGFAKWQIDTYFILRVPVSVNSPLFRPYFFSVTGSRHCLTNYPSWQGVSLELPVELLQSTVCCIQWVLWGDLWQHFCSIVLSCHLNGSEFKPVFSCL